MNKNHVISKCGKKNSLRARREKEKLKFFFSRSPSSLEVNKLMCFATTERRSLIQICALHFL